MVHESNIPTETCARDLTACSILNWRKMRWRNEVFEKDFLKYNQLFYFLQSFQNFEDFMSKGWEHQEWKLDLL